MVVHEVCARGFAIFTTIIVLLTIVYSTDPTVPTDLNHDPEETMNATEVINYHGYPAEEYTVTTSDGYMIYIQHIPHGKNNSDPSVERKPVFIQHGLVSASTSWLYDLPYKTLPFLLADRDYDVWLGNFRGNSYGRRHTTLNPDEKDFWLFSFHEMGIYDLPAMIDFVLNKTGYPHLHYIGHSMGTTAAFIMLSVKPEYNSKLRSFNALAPVAQINHCQAPVIITLAPLCDQLYQILSLLGSYEFLPNQNVTQLLGNTVCGENVTDELCSTGLFLFAGFDYPQFNESRLPVYMHFYPDGASTQTLQHFGQLYKNQRFQFYDYGDPMKNLKAYNQIIPPLYDIDKITAPVALYWGDNDWLATPTDVAYIVKKIPNQSLVLNYRVDYDQWNHGDFLWALDVNDLVYFRVIETLKNLWP